MLGLGQTTANLAKNRQRWQHLLSSSKARTARFEGGATLLESPLQEVTGFGSNPGNLRMFAHVPADLPPSAPLVVVLHGCTQDAAGYAVGAGWTELADRFGFAVLAPQQERANNPNLCFTWFEAGDLERDAGEPMSMRQMIERMVVDHDLDRGRVYVTGLSAGGAMTSVMLATYPEIFAGGAIVAGLPYRCATSTQEAFACMFQGVGRAPEEWGDLVRAASPHKGPWPRVSVWHGSADSTVKAMNADEIVKQWTDVHGIALAPSAEGVVDGVPRRAWTNAAGETVVEDFIVPGMAHGTPIGDGDGEAYGTAAPFILDAGISSTYHIATFWGLTGVERPVLKKAAAPRTRAEPKPGNGASQRAVAPTSGKAPGGRRRSNASPQDGARSSGRTLDPGAIIAKALKAAGLLKG